MSDFDMEEEKIPYDTEPIQRNAGADYYRYLKEQKKHEKQKKAKSKNWLIYAVVALGVVVAVLGVSLFSISGKIAKLSKNGADYTMNISTTGGDQAYAVAKGMLSTVCVSASSTNNGADVNAFFSNSMSSRGSGVILELNKDKGDAIIVTNYHVVSNTSTNKVYSYRWVLLWDSVTPIAASYIGGTSKYDIAVLKIENSEEIKNSSCQPATIASSADVCIGEYVCAIGNSRARNLRITTGVVSVEEDLMGSGTYNMYLSHSADVNSGNSGGGLYNSRGELVGIVNAKFRDVNETTGELMYYEVIHGMNYAIPVDIAYNIAKNIIRNDSNPLKPALGLTIGESYSYYDKTFTITDDGLGYTTYSLIITKSVGKFWVNDELLSLTYKSGGKDITVKLDRLFALDSALFNLDQGSEVSFIVKRGSSQTTLKVTVDSVASVS